MNMTFKIGDKVKVSGTHYSFDGKEGIISGVHPERAAAMVTKISPLAPEGKYYVSFSEMTLVEADPVVEKEDVVFNIGDKVRVTGDKGRAYHSLEAGTIGTYAEPTSSTKWLRIVPDDDMYPDQWVHRKDLELVSKAEPASVAPLTKGSSDGKASEYYDFPEGASTLNDLIEYKNMTFAQGNIFKAAYRLGHKEGITTEYDLNKIIYYAERMLNQLKEGK